MPAVHSVFARSWIEGVSPYIEVIESAYTRKHRPSISIEVLALVWNVPGLTLHFNSFPYGSYSRDPLQNDAKTMGLLHIMGSAVIKEAPSLHPVSGRRDSSVLSYLWSQLWPSHPSPLFLVGFHLCCYFSVLLCVVQMARSKVPLLGIILLFLNSTPEIECPSRRRLILIQHLCRNAQCSSRVVRPSR